MILVLSALVLLWFGRFARDYFDPNSPANLSMQVQLKMFGTAFYEYHSHTGLWPTKIDDLAQTSLPRAHVAEARPSQLLEISGYRSLPS